MFQQQALTKGPSVKEITKAAESDKAKDQQPLTKALSQNNLTKDQPKDQAKEQAKAPDGDADKMNASWNKNAKTAVEAAMNNEPTFTKLDLSNNTVFAMKHQEYCEQLGAALAKNTHLVSVTLVKCDLDHRDAAAIAAGLRVNTHLICLNLSNNKITNEGATAIADALRENNTLLELNLLGQPHEFGEPCLQGYIDLFSYNVTLTKIIWRLNSRKSFAINKLIVRNNTIRKWVAEGKDVKDILPATSNVPYDKLSEVFGRFNPDN